MSANNRLHLYTGDGKGKTTAAMGLALRALGHGERMLAAQFLKNGKSGELNALRQFENARVLPGTPLTKFTFRMTEAEKAETAAQQARQAEDIARTIREFQPEMIVLDEFAQALALGLLPEAIGRQLLAEALKSGETAVTGRKTPEWLAEQADYVSRIVAERHPYATEGLAARKGVEW